MIKPALLLTTALCIVLSAPAQALRCAAPNMKAHAESLLEKGIEFSIGYGQANTMSYQEVESSRPSIGGAGGSGWHQFNGAFITKDGLGPAEHFKFQSTSTCIGGYCAGSPVFDLHGDGRPVLFFFRHGRSDRDGIKTVKSFIVNTPCQTDVYKLKNTRDLWSLQHLLQNADKVSAPASESRPTFAPPRVSKTNIKLNMCQDPRRLIGSASYEIELKESTRQIWLGGAAVDIGAAVLNHNNDTGQERDAAYVGGTPSIKASDEENLLDVRFIDFDEDVPAGRYALNVKFESDKPKGLEQLCAPKPSSQHKFNPEARKMSELIPAFHGEQHKSYYDISVNLPARFDVAFNVGAANRNFEKTSHSRITHHASLSPDTVPSSRLAMSIGGKMIFGNEMALSGVTSLSLGGTQWRHPDIANARIGFRKDGSLEGSGGCNAFLGQYKTKESQLTITRGLATQRRCSAGVNKSESDFFESLNQTAYAVNSSADLYLLGKDRQSLMRLGSATPLLHSRLFRVKWAHPAARTMRVSFSEDGTVTGNSGCNELMGKMKIKPMDANINQVEFRVGGTERGCDRRGGALEDRLFTAFNEAVLMRESEQGLQLIGTDDAVLITLEPEFIW